LGCTSVKYENNISSNILSNFIWKNTAVEYQNDKSERILVTNYLKFEEETYYINRQYNSMGPLLGKDKNRLYQIEHSSYYVKDNQVYLLHEDGAEIFDFKNGQLINNTAIYNWQKGFDININEIQNGTSLVGQFTHLNSINNPDIKSSLEFGKSNVYVTIENLYTNKKYVIKTDKYGFFYVPNIIPGKYYASNITDKETGLSDDSLRFYFTIYENFTNNIGRFYYENSQLRVNSKYLDNSFISVQNIYDAFYANESWGMNNWRNEVPTVNII
jgi:hypothetical protein